VRQGETGRGGHERHLLSIDKRERRDRQAEVRQGKKEGGEDGSDTYSLLTREREREEQKPR
jgi:hypothetical protein